MGLRNTRTFSNLILWNVFAEAENNLKVQNCLDISDHDVVETVKVKQLSLTFLFLALQDYPEEFANPSQDCPHYKKQLDKLGEEE